MCATLFDATAAAATQPHIAIAHLHASQELIRGAANDPRTAERRCLMAWKMALHCRYKSMSENDRRERREGKKRKMTAKERESEASVAPPSHGGFSIDRETYVFRSGAAALRVVHQVNVVPCTGFHGVDESEEAGVVSALSEKSYVFFLLLCFVTFKCEANLNDRPVKY